MEMAVLLEPTDTGFKATSLTVAELNAEGGTEQEALQAIRNRLEERIGTRGKIVHLPIDDGEFLKSWKSLSESTDWPAFEQILRDQRMKSDAQDLIDYGTEDGAI